MAAHSKMRLGFFNSFTHTHNFIRIDDLCDK